MCEMVVWGACLLYLAAKAGPPLCEYLAEREQARRRQEAAEEDARFMRAHPEAWQAKELVRLEQERLAAQRALAEAEAARRAELDRQENNRRNAGVIVAAGRCLGLW
jgi:hypothetical protein